MTSIRSYASTLTRLLRQVKTVGSGREAERAGVPDCSFRLDNLVSPQPCTATKPGSGLHSLRTGGVGATVTAECGVAIADAREAPAAVPPFDVRRRAVSRRRDHRKPPSRIDVSPERYSWSGRRAAQSAHPVRARGRGVAGHPAADHRQRLTVRAPALTQNDAVRAAVRERDCPGRWGHGRSPGNEASFPGHPVRHPAVDSRRWRGSGDRRGSAAPRHRSPPEGTPRNRARSRRERYRDSRTCWRVMADVSGG